MFLVEDEPDAASALLEYVSSDMWAPYLRVIRKKAVNALNILDRFHIMKKFNEAIDEIRRQEAKELLQHSKEHILVHSRWALLKNKPNLTEKQVVKLKGASSTETPLREGVFAARGFSTVLAVSVNRMGGEIS